MDIEEERKIYKERILKKIKEIKEIYEEQFEHLKDRSLKQGFHFLAIGSQQIYLEYRQTLTELRSMLCEERNE